MSDTKLRIRIAEAEVEVNGRVGRVRAATFEGTFDQSAPAVLGDVLALLSPDRAEVVQLREQVTALQTRGTELVEERRALKASNAALADALPEAAKSAFAAGQKHERGREKKGGKAR